MRISSPPTTNPCYYGIDTPTREELIASSHTVEEIREYLGADSLAYLSHAGLFAFNGGRRDGFCDACFTGQLPRRPGRRGADAASCTSSRRASGRPASARLAAGRSPGDRRPAGARPCRGARPGRWSG